MKRRFWIWLLFLIFVYLQYRLWFSQHGLLYMWKLENSITQQEASNHQAKRCNQKLAEEIIYFRNSKDALEERARYELDMIKSDEVYVSIDDTQTKEEAIAECESLP